MEPCKECGNNTFIVRFNGRTTERMSCYEIDIDEDDIFCVTCPECEYSWYLDDLIEIENENITGNEDDDYLLFLREER